MAQKTMAAVEAAGVDRLLEELAGELREKRYCPQPVRGVYIPKPGQPCQLRGLGIPAIRDRIVQAAVKLVIEPILEADFRWETKARGAKLIRYCDDYVMLCRGEPQPWFQRMERIMMGLGLILNAEKTRLVDATEGFDVSGCTSA